MTPEQITAIAREYAEWTGETSPIALDLKQRNMERHLEWLSTRCCLVEKEGLKKKYAELKSEWRMAKGTDVYTALPKMELIESLFPEIAKEVES